MRMKLGERKYNFGFGRKTLESTKTLFVDETDVGELDHRDTKRNVKGGIGPFDLIWDDTDHFNFICNKCGSIPNVDRVCFDIVQFYPTLRFYLHCQGCGSSGQRKIYCNDNQEIGMMRATGMEKVYDFRRRLSQE